MKYREILEGLLLEIDMRPSYLKAEAQTLNARAGMEFEMIVPNVESDPDDDNSYDNDEYVTGWHSIEYFFEDDNDIRTLQRAYRSLHNEFKNDPDGQDHIRDEAWREMKRNGEAEDLIRQEIEDDIGSDLEDEAKELEDDERDSDDIYQELLNDRVAQSMRNQDEYHDRARDSIDIEDEFDKWISHVFDRMSDVHSWLEQEGEELEWPGGYSSGGDSIADVALDFMQAMGYDTVAYSESYHGQYKKWDSGSKKWVTVGTTKPRDCFTVEPDGSLEPLGDDSDRERGLEFVAPAMPLDQTLSDLQKVKAWADSRGCYTGHAAKTGLHINVSVPNVGENNENIDYVKLALLLGDKYVLEEFERLGNTYAASALDLVKNKIKANPKATKDILDKMKQGMNKIAKHTIQSSQYGPGGVGKYTSIHPKTGYIEFRSPGGDWLNAKFDKIENTLMRFVVALDASIDESKYADEYAKKLYKAIDPKSEKMGDDTIANFVKYSTGGYNIIGDQGLSKEVKNQLMLQAKQYRAKNPATAQEMKKFTAMADRYYQSNPVPSNMTKDEAVEERAQLESLLDVYNYIILPRHALKTGLKKTQFQRLAAKGQLPKGSKAWYSVHTGGKGARNGASYDVVATSPEDALEQVALQNKYNNIDHLKYNHPNVEVELKGPYTEPKDKNDKPNYEIYNKVTGLAVEKFHAEDDEAAKEFLDQYHLMGPHPFNVEQARQRFDARPIESDKPHNWEIFNITDNSSVLTFYAGNEQDAVNYLKRYINTGPHGLTAARADDVFDARRVFLGTARPSGPSQSAWAPPPPDTSTGAFSQEQLPRRQDGSMTAPENDPDANFAIIRSSDNAVITYFTRNTRQEAEQAFTRWLSSQGLASSLMRHSNSPPYYIIEIRPRSAPESRASSGGFTGTWLIKDHNGRVLHRFSGVGNVQADANHYAINWLRQNPHHLSADLEVVPEMR